MHYNFVIAVRLILLTLLMGTSSFCYPQSNNFYVHYLDELPNVVQADKTIIPSSVVLKWAHGTSPLPEYHIENNTITVDSVYYPSPIKISFRVFPFNLEEPIQKYQIHDQSHIGHIETITSTSESTGMSNLFQTSGIKYYGSFGRSITGGNAQSVVLNSNLNLQLSGKLHDDIEIKAAISDQSLPIQPEGNTQQLQEFDKVFIQISKDHHQLTAGDFQLSRPAGYFLTHTKKLSGLQYQNNLDLSDTWQQANEVNFAISRGTYTRHRLSTQEGNQGPYYVSEDSDVGYIIVLAGTERVFLDDRLLTRGADQDYIIDYNTGQITFMPSILITKDSRVLVEYEYIDQEYGTTLFATRSELSTEKSKFYFNAFHQQDSKQPSQGLYNDSTFYSSMQNAGDQLDQLKVDNIRRATSEDMTERVIYSLKDTSYTINGRLFDTTVLVFNPHPSETNAYVARFTRVGPNQGQYILLPSSINGRIYQWVSPDSLTGRLQGAYMPQTSTKAPESHQVFSLGGKTQLSKNVQVKSEMAMSRLDRNRLSSLNEGDNWGMAGMAEMEWSQPLGDSDWELTSHGRIEINDERFHVVTPFRNQEFSRDWNLQVQNAGLRQLSLRSGIKNGTNQILYIYENLKNDSGFNGNRHSATINYENDRWEINGRPSLLQASQKNSEILFFRPDLSVTRKLIAFNDLEVGVRYLGELSDSRDSLGLRTTESFSFNEARFHISLPRTKGLNARLEMTAREDALTLEHQWKKVSSATNWALKMNYNNSNGWILNSSVSYRDLRVTRPDISQQQSQKSLLGRVDNRFLIHRGFIQSHSIYEISNGQTPQLEYSFEERRPGEGQYIYQDLNDDGIQQLNEFIEAPHSDTARYVKIQLYNSEFIRTQNLNFTQNLRISPKHLWKDAAPEWIKRMSWLTVYKSRLNKSQETVAVNPFSQLVGDTSLISGHQSLQNTFFINQGNPAWDLNFNHRKISASNQGVAGRETSLKSIYEARLRINLWKTHDIILKGQFSNDQADSEQFEERNYDIQGMRFGPEWNSVFNRTLRLQGHYKWESRINSERLGGEKAIIHEWQAECQVRRSGKDAFRASLTYASVEIDDSGNEVLNFTLLQGMRSGNNYHWGLGYDRLLMKSIQLSLNYRGRKNGMGKVIHTGQASIKATF